MPTSPSTNLSLTPQPGHLYVVATPIGNLADLTDRARAILGQVDAVACEDTRTTGLLLSRLGLKRDLIPYHDHNESKVADHIAQQIAEGRSIALVSDAGTPAISDPGFRLVRACRRQNIPVVPVSGPCAITTALSASALPTDGFLFVGFLPPKSAARKNFLQKYRDFDYTIALYESCHRIEKFANEIVTELGADRVICIAKEITKLHETFHVGPAGEVRDRLLRGSLKGEFVVLIAPTRYSL
jgi:16S rRNA (cytidine1402-2'-O)-methyltransferase